MFTLAESIVLMSWFKPLLFLTVLGSWGWCVSFLDKDLMLQHLQRNTWNCCQMAAGIVAMLAVMFIPWFWLGLPLSVLIMYGPILGYVMYRNSKVSEDEKWRFSLESIRSRIDEKQQAGAQKRAEVTLLGPSGESLPVPGGSDPQAAPHAAFESLMEFALPRAAEHVEILVTPQKTAVVVNVDGVDFPQPEIDARVGLQVVDYLKQAANLDVQDRRRLQNGKLKIRDSQRKEHVLNLSTSGSTRGLSLLVQLDPDRHGMVKLDKLGLLPPQLESLKSVLDEPGRAVIVACPPQQGMTTTLYSLVDTHDPYTESIMTLEEEVRFELEGVVHNVIEPGTDAEALAQRLAGMLRRDPKAVLLSKVTDSQIAQVIAGSTSEVRFYFGLYMEDTFQAVKAWTKAIGDSHTAADALAAIVTPRLFRKLCITCRQPYHPDAGMLRKMNLSADKVKTLYRQSGQVMVRDKMQICPACHGVGYRGRSAVFEVLTMDETARELLAASQFDQLRAHLRKQRMLLLAEAALAKVVEGVTSIGEVTRVLSNQPAGAAKPVAAS